MKIKIVAMLFSWMLVFSVVSVTGVLVEDISNTNVENSVDWWPMFGHDTHHTRYSTSSAPDTNAVLWSSNIGISVRSSPAVVNDRLYIGCSIDSCPTTHKLYCLNTENGLEHWSYDLGTSDIESSPAVYADRVYFGTMEGKVFCLNANTGGFIWEYNCPSQVFSSPAVVDDKVYVNSRDIYCLDAIGNGDGTTDLLWQSDTPHGDSSPAVYEGKVYAGTNDKSFFCFDAETGDEEWWYKPQGSTYMVSSPAIVDDPVYVGGMESFYVYCLDADPSDGEDEGLPNDGQVGDGFDLIWIAETTAAVWSSPAVYDGKVYVGSFDHNVYCFDAATGDFVWSYPTGYWVRSSPAVADGKVFVGAEDGKVYCLDAEDGDLVWDYQTGEAVVSCPAVAGGIVYIGSYDGTVYAFGSPGGNNPPYEPTDPNPEDGAVDVDVDADLSWTGGDPDGDPVTYDIYFGTSTPPPLVEPGHNEESFDPGTMNHNTTYYWQIVAKDGELDTSGDIWSFTTRSEGNYPDLEIQEIKGGIGIRAIIKNVGNASAIDTHWEIHIEGGFVIWPRDFADNIFGEFPPGETAVAKVYTFGISLGFIAELPMISVDVTCAEESEDHMSVSALILGPFVFMP